MINIIFISAVVLMVLVLLTKVYDIYKLYKEKIREEFNLKSGIVTLADIKTLNAEEFLQWGRGLLTSLGYGKITYVDDKYLFGPYITAVKDDIHYLIFLNHNLNISIIAKLISTVLALNNKNILVITSDITSEEVNNYLSSIPMTLNFIIIDGEELVRILSNLRKKELSLLEDFS